MNPKSRDASISDRLEQIKNAKGLDAALMLVNEKRLGVSQREADVWAAKQTRGRSLPRFWSLLVGLAGIISAVAAVIALFPRAP